MHEGFSIQNSNALFSDFYVVTYGHLTDGGLEGPNEMKARKPDSRAASYLMTGQALAEVR
jgi:hypothetical protein